MDCVFTVAHALRGVIRVECSLPLMYSFNKTEAAVFFMQINCITYIGNIIKVFSHRCAFYSLIVNPCGQELPHLLINLELFV